MGLLDGLQRLWEVMESQLFNVPTDNTLGWVYVILNGILLLLATLFGTGGSGGVDILPF